MDQHAEAGDNHKVFLRGRAPHFLYLWHLSDTAELLTGMVQVLSKSVSADSNHVYTSTESIQKKQGLSKEKAEEQKEAQKFQKDISCAINEIAKSGKLEAYHWGLEAYYQGLQELCVMEDREDELLV
jgi:hypothetical protein